MGYYNLSGLEMFLDINLSTPFNLHVRTGNPLRSSDTCPDHRAHMNKARTRRKIS